MKKAFFALLFLLAAPVAIVALLMERNCCSRFELTVVNPAPVSLFGSLEVFNLDSGRSYERSFGRGIAAGSEARYQLELDTLAPESCRNFVFRTAEGQLWGRVSCPDLKL